MIDNEFYNDLHDKWYLAEDHPIALLRAENASRFPWILQTIRNRFGEKKCKILDIGCGGGLTANRLAEEGHTVTGIDLSLESLGVAKKKDSTQSVEYIQEDAYKLSFKKESFDVVLALDFLEHVDEPQNVIRQTASVLRPSGIFFFHTFNRNLWSYLIAIKGVEWFVKNTPKNMHVYSLFIKPEEIEKYCLNNQLKVQTILGSSPKINGAFWKMLFTGRISKDFQFRFSNSLRLGYTGYAIKDAHF